MLRLCSVAQVIKVQTSPTQVEAAVLHVADMDTNMTDMRVAAMHRRSPLHTFMFDRNGALLNANESALGAFQHYQAGEHEHEACMQLRNQVIYSCKVMHSGHYDIVHTV